MLVSMAVPQAQGGGHREALPRAASFYRRGSGPRRAPDQLCHIQKRPCRRPLRGRTGNGAVINGTVGSMPWLPELLSAPVLRQVLDQRRRDALWRCLTSTVCWLEIPTAG